MHDTMKKKPLDTIVTQEERLEKIRWHLTKQFNLHIDQVDKMLPSFIDTLGAHMSNLEDALAENDLDLFGKYGHTIKGAFLNLGMADCAQIALAIEEKGQKGGNLPELIDLMERLRVLIKPILE
jgi:HPt (histidine-containing phosphotransfer) domain-containing protein